MLEWVKIGIPFENIYKKYQIFTGIVYFGVMKKFAYRTEDSVGGAGGASAPPLFLPSPGIFALN